MATIQLTSRRRFLGAKGRPMTLRRQAGIVSAPTYIDVTVQAFLNTYRPEQLTGDIHQGDAVVEILNDEILAAAWPGPPKRRDFVLVDGSTWAVQGVFPYNEAANLIGFALWVRGGQ